MLRLVCDKTVDCLDGSDEAGCNYFEGQEPWLASQSNTGGNTPGHMNPGNVNSGSWMPARTESGSGSSVGWQSGVPIRGEESDCPPGEAKCDLDDARSKCVPMYKFCDRKNDCPNNEDEVIDRCMLLSQYLHEVDSNYPGGM